MMNQKRGHTYVMPPGNWKSQESQTTSLKFKKKKKKKKKKNKKKNKQKKNIR